MVLVAKQAVMNFDINELTAPPAPIQWMTYSPKKLEYITTAKTWFDARATLSAILGVEPTQLDVKPYGHQ